MRHGQVPHAVADAVRTVAARTGVSEREACRAILLELFEIAHTLSDEVEIQRPFRITPEDRERLKNAGWEELTPEEEEGMREVTRYFRERRLAEAAQNGT